MSMPPMRPPPGMPFHGPPGASIPQQAGQAPSAAPPGSAPGKLHVVVINKSQAKGTLLAIHVIALVSEVMRTLRDVACQHGLVI